jgi:hypothetical protein
MRLPFEADDFNFKIGSEFLKANPLPFFQVQARRKLFLVACGLVEGLEGIDVTRC